MDTDTDADDLNELSDEERRARLMESGRPRLFRAGKGRARGKTGREDLDEFVENLPLLQEASVRIGEQLEMDVVSHCIVYEKDSTVAYRYDSDSNPRSPLVVGALVNRQAPIRELLKAMADH